MTTDDIMALADQYADNFEFGGSRQALREAIDKLVVDAERYRWLAEHPNEWRLYRKHGKHKLPFKMMRDGDPWGQSFASAGEAIDAARSKT